MLHQGPRVIVAHVGKWRGPCVHEKLAKALASKMGFDRDAGRIALLGTALPVSLTLVLCFT